MDPVWVAKVDLPAAEEGSLRSVIETKKADQTPVHHPLSESMAWWKPQHEILRRQFWPNEQTLVRVILSQEHGHLSAYLECAVF